MCISKHMEKKVSMLGLSVKRKAMELNFRIIKILGSRIQVSFCKQKIKRQRYWVIYSELFLSAKAMDFCDHVALHQAFVANSDYSHYSLFFEPQLNATDFCDSLKCNTTSIAGIVTLNSVLGSCHASVIVLNTFMNFLCGS